VETWIFRIAGIYGLLSLLPMYFLEAQFPAQSPPALTHPEYFYGFISVGLTWQVLFLLIASDPRRFRPLMLVALLEKISFGVPCILLYLGGRLAGTTFAISQIDWIFFVLFIVAWIRSGRPLQPAA
jgi:hypothetical protein